MKIVRKESLNYIGLLDGIVVLKDLKTTVLDKLSPLMCFGYYSSKAWFVGIIYLNFQNYYDYYNYFKTKPTPCKTIGDLPTK